jgi:hypothetical protein
MLDVIEMADRRTRFALLLLGSLNAANLLMVARSDMFGVAAAARPWIHGRSRRGRTIAPSKSPAHLTRNCPKHSSACARLEAGALGVPTVLPLGAV